MSEGPLARSVDVVVGGEVASVASYSALMSVVIYFGSAGEYCWVVGMSGVPG